MALLSTVFPALNLKPEIYYALLADVREDAFIAAVDRICRTVKELYPNTNLVALIRGKAEEWILEQMHKRLAVSNRQTLEVQEPDYEQVAEAKKDWDEMLAKLAAEKDMKKAL